MEKPKIYSRITSLFLPRQRNNDVETAESAATANIFQPVQVQQDIIKVCVKCQETSPSDNNFCVYCGANLPEPVLI